MSKLTSFTSASDALIQPTGATSGQTLTWNATTGQFEPTTPASAGTTLPNFANNLVLRGDGTNVPVTDNRLDFATANAVDIGGTSGLRVSTATAGQINLNLLGTAVAAGNALRLTSQSAIGSDNNGGNIEFTTGATTGSGFASIRFNTPLSFGTAGATLNAPALTWQMYTNTLNTIFEGLGNDNLISAQNDKNLKVATSGVGNLQIQAEGTGTLSLGTTGTGNINVGTNSTTRLTTLNGIVKRPNYARLTVANAANQALAANTASPVVFGGINNIVGSGLTQPTTSTFSVARIGLYQIDLNLSIQSATANTRGIVSITAGTATLTNQPAGMLTKAIRLAAANTAQEFTWSLFLPVTVAGTFSVSVTTIAASQINNYNGAAGTAATTNISILEMA